MCLNVGKYPRSAVSSVRPVRIISVVHNCHLVWSIVDAVHVVYFSLEVPRCLTAGECDFIAECGSLTFNAQILKISIPVVRALAVPLGCRF